MGVRRSNAPLAPDVEGDDVDDASTLPPASSTLPPSSQSEEDLTIVEYDGASTERPKPLVPDKTRAATPGRIAEILQRFAPDVARLRHNEEKAVDADFDTIQDVKVVRPRGAKRRTSEAPATQRATDGSLPFEETMIQQRPRPTAAQKRLGTVVAGRYRLLRVLGEGGMGTVFEASHIDLGKRVAIKILSAFGAHHEEASARFLREARAASAPESEHIVHVFDVGEDLNVGLYMVMESLKGEDLASLLERRGRLQPEEAVGIAWQVSLALERAHGAGIVHRDLKPANVFLSRSDDGSTHVKVLDFGIAKLLRDAQESSRRGITKGGAAVGTPQYMSPEQAQGLPTVGPATDVYSLGSLLHEAVTGKPPYPELDSYEQTIVNILMKPPPKVSELVPTIDPRMEALVDALMAREPDARPTTMPEVRAKLAEICPGIESRRLVLSGLVVPPALASGALPATGGGVAVESARSAAARARRVSRVAPAVALVASFAAVIAVGLSHSWPGDRAQASRAPATASESAPPGAPPIAMAPVLTEQTAPNHEMEPVAPATAEAPPDRSPAAAPMPAPHTPRAAPVAAAAPSATTEAPSQDAAGSLRDAQRALEHGSASRAIPLARHAADLAPQNAEAWLTLAAAYEAAGNAAAARAVYAACAKQATGGRRAECAALLAQ